VDQTPADEATQPPPTTPQTRCPLCAAQTVVVTDPSGIYRWVDNPRPADSNWNRLNRQEG